MNAIEFQSTIREDGSIAVPLEYVGNIGKNVRVILLSNEMFNHVNKPNFSAVSIKTNGFKFDRESANER